MLNCDPSMLGSNKIHWEQQISHKDQKQTLYNSKGGNVLCILSFCGIQLYMFVGIIALFKR